MFAFQAHIAAEIMDIEPDIIANKKTIITLIGRKKTKLLMLLILLLEVYILSCWFEDYVLAGFLSLFSSWLILDLFIFFKEMPYTTNQIKFFGVAMNLCAFFSMLWALYSGKILTSTF